MGNCCSKNPPHHVSTPSSPPPMESSLLPSGPPSPPIDAIQKIRGIYEKIDPVELIQPLVSFIENHLYKMNTPSEAGSSSSEGSLAAVPKGIQHAATITDILSTEAGKVSQSDAVKEIGRITLTVLEGLGELHRVFIGVSLAAFATERYMRSPVTVNELRELLLKVLHLAKKVKVYGEQMSKTVANDLPMSEREKLFNAVVTIVEGVVISCDYMNKGEGFRCWSAMTAAAQLEKTNQQLKDVTDSIALCSLQRHWDKDVFLSHSGKQKNFVRQLHQNLTREHVSCFFDEDHNSLPLGQRFPPLIFKAAETSKIAVLVLSNEFIRSKWPMLELSAFISTMKSGKNANLKLLPIFFMISPNELALTKDSPEWQDLNVSNDTRVKWEDALKFVRSINGLRFDQDGNEVAFRDEVMEAIRCLVKGINRRPQLLDFQPVGIEEQVREVMILLDLEGSQSALAVIVCGFGGVGKSTVAASVVQSLDWPSTYFKFCWVSIDKTQDKTSHILKLQKDIINDLQGDKPDLRNLEEGRVEIKKALIGKCSLLFIDNVVDSDYVKDLLPKDLPCNEQETKLRIIITSREKIVKAELSIMCKEYEAKCLSDKASKSLLSKIILQNSAVKDKDEEGMMNEVAAACKGVPLLLSVFGKHLRVERDESSYQKERYEEVLEVLREGNLDSYRDEDLGTKLMFVYNKIKDVEVKEAFLDICTYFHGREWNLVVDIVDLPKLEDLHRRALVSKSSSGELIVHDILRCMGMKAARLTRFSNYKELSHALEGNLDGFDMKGVKGISLLSESSLITIESTKLEAMHRSLRILMLGDWVTLEGAPCRKAFISLRYLHVGDITTFPFKDPSKLDKLRVFLNRSKPGMSLSSLPSSLKRVSHEVPAVECDKFVKLPFQNLSSLKSLIVQRQGQRRKLVRFTKERPASVELPEELHLPVSLVYLDLSTCKNLPKDIGHLTALESVILDRSDLERLPQEFGKLKKLKHLSMDYCSKLAFLHEELDMLSSLEALSLNDCRNLRALPESLGGLISLQTIEFSECIKLQELPESFCKLRIQSLNLHSLDNLNKLPNSFGNMALLKDLRLESCHSLMSLPTSFVQLKMLETLKIINCTKLTHVPQNFGRLSCLKSMTVEKCHLLKELPHGFGALPALKTFRLVWCDRIFNFPAGFGKLKKLRLLDVRSCYQLKTLSDDFENMATLEQLSLCCCPQLDGAMMEKIVKLANCYRAEICESRKLLEKWKHLKREAEHPIVVIGGRNQREREEEQIDGIRVALLQGKCMEVKNGSDQLMERSSLLEGLEEGTSATGALIMLPINMQSHQHHTLQRIVEKARERAESNGWGKLQIVCARKVDLWAERSTATEEEERAEEEGIRQILLSLPKGSFAIPSSECKRVKILTYCLDEYNERSEELGFFRANVGVDIEGRKCFENFKFTKEDEISGNQSPLPKPSVGGRMEENKHYNSMQNFIIESVLRKKEKSYIDLQWKLKAVCGTTVIDKYSRSQCVAAEFLEALKSNGIDYLLADNNTSKVMVDDLHGKAIGFIICDFKFFKCVKLEQVYKDLQKKDPNFIWIWIPNVLSEDCGHGSYTRLIQCMPWATFPHPQLVNVQVTYRDSCFLLLDKHGQIANRDALPLLMGWGVKSYPFTKNTIPESFSLMESESCLEFLLQGMDIVGRKQMKSKMTFLYAQRQMEFQMCKLEEQLEELTQIHHSFEVLYVGEFCEWEYSYERDLKEYFEDATQNMRWPSLSFFDMNMFWYRCKYFASEEVYVCNKESNIMIESLHGLAKDLLQPNISSITLVDKGGVVTHRGDDVVQMICESSDDEEGMGMVKDELMTSLSRGECTAFVKAFLRERINDLPQHPQHYILYFERQGGFTCDVCGRLDDGSVKRSYKCRSYKCVVCGWNICGSCWVGICQTAI